MNPYKLAAIIFLLLQTQAYAYTTHFNAPAVLTGLDRGILTNITLNVTPGNGTIRINNGSAGVAADTAGSVKTAVAYAANYLKINQNSYNFSFKIGNNDTNISGPSGGFALTLLTLSGLEQRPLLGNFTVTGTISPNGSVGPVGGVFDKVQAAKSVGSRFILVPYVDNTSSEYLLYYLSQQTYNTPVIEISNLSEGLPYAFGDKTPTYLNFNITTDYRPGQIQNESAICPTCNESIFKPLTNFTFNYTESEINKINGTMFGSIKSQLLGQLQQYRQLSAKGYYYTGADLAFIEDPTAFMFSNYNTSKPVAAQIIANISAQCEALNYTPNMTSANYELVIGGEARFAWAMTTLKAAKEYLNASQTSDDVIISLDIAAPARAWCAATGEMYNLSAAVGGTPVGTSSAIRSQATSRFYSAQSLYGSHLYVNSANYSINNGDYAAALYSLTYANVFYNTSPANYSQMPAMVSNALATSSGVWPTQFALQSYFYQNEANLTAKNLQEHSGYVSDAYTTAMLAISLNNLNSNLQANFVVPQIYNGNIQTQINQISSELTLMTYVLGVVMVLMIVILVVLIFILTKKPEEKRKKR